MYYFENKITNYKYDYADLAQWLNHTFETDAKAAKKQMYVMNKADLFFLLYFTLDIRAINHPWLIPKIYEIQENHNGTLDLWSRELYKSTILSYALPIWEIINNPEERIGLFSNTRGLAKKFLRRIKHTLEMNKLLLSIHSDVFYQNPEKESPKWSEDDGLMVMRKGAYAQMSFEAWGVIEAMPIGAHFSIMNFDDLVTWDSTRTAEQILKTKEGFQLASLLGETEGGRVRVIGTRYDFNDLYSDMIKSGNWKVRRYRGDIQPSFWTDEQIEKKREDLGPYNFATQISLEPISKTKRKLEISWIKYYDKVPKGLNFYILCDPAGDTKTNRSSYTVFGVIGVDWNKNKFLVDMVRDRLGLGQKWAVLRDLYVKWSQMGEVLNVGYEKYSMQADIGYLEDKMLEEGIVFHIEPLGGNIPKDDRIETLVPDLAAGKWWFSFELWYTDVEGQVRNLMKEFLDEEYKYWPHIKFKDMLDMLARINDRDLDVIYPDIPAEEKVNKATPEDYYWRSLFMRTKNTTWMARR